MVDLSEEVEPKGGADAAEFQRQEPGRSLVLGGGGKSKEWGADGEKAKRKTATPTKQLAVRSSLAFFVNGAPGRLLGERSKYSSQVAQWKTPETFDSVSAFGQAGQFIIQGVASLILRSSRNWPGDAKDRVFGAVHPSKPKRHQQEFPPSGAFGRTRPTQNM